MNINKLYLNKQYIFETGSVCIVFSNLSFQYNVTAVLYLVDTYIKFTIKHNGHVN